MDLIHIAPVILQRLYNAPLTKREDVILRLFETITAVTRLTIVRASDADPTCLDDLPLDLLVNAITDMMLTKD